MAFPLVVNSISSIPEIAISKTNESVNVPKARIEIWNVFQPPTNEGADGSSEPVGFSIPVETTTRYTVPISIDGICNFPAGFPRPSICKLTASLNLPSGKVQQILESEDWLIPPPPSNPPPPVPFQLSHVKMASPFSDKICPVPFRWAGDVSWKVVSEGQKDLECASTTRLELCFFKAPAPSGPNLVRTTFMKTAIDLEGKYPISVLRLFLPRPTEFQTLPKFDMTYDFWWAKRAVEKFKQAAVYNTISGRSGYGIGCCGGSFDFAAWDNALNPLLNSFDTTAVLQIASSLLLQAGTYEVLDSTWTCQTPYGYIKPSMPFGLNESSSPAVSWPNGVDNPFFCMTEPPGPPYVIPKDLDQKSVWLVRSWLEVMINKGRKVLDVACDVPSETGDQPLRDAGGRNRIEYAAAHLEKDLGNSLNYWDSVPNPTGTCFVNNDFSLRQTGEVFKSDAPMVARVGVYDLNGISMPRTGPVPAPFVPLPPSLRSHIKEVVLKGRNIDFPPIAFNDASLKPPNVFQYLTRIPGSKAGQAGIKVARGVTICTYQISDVPITAFENGSMITKIHIYDKYYNACEALAAELSKFECDVREAITPLRSGPSASTFIGHYSLQTPHSIVFIRGNVYAELTLVGIAKPIASSMVEVVRVATALDRYLSFQTVLYSQVRRPSLAMSQLPPRTAEAGTRFTIALKDRELIASKPSSRSSNGRSLLVCGPPNDTMQFDFLALQPLSMTEKVDITVAAAHPETFHPGFVTFSVTIEENSAVSGT